MPTLVNITGQAANCSQGALGITAAVNLSIVGQSSNSSQGLVRIAGANPWTVQNNVSTTWVIQ